MRGRAFQMGRLRNGPRVTAVIGEAGKDGKHVLVFVFGSGLAPDCPEKAPFASSRM